MKHTFTNKSTTSTTSSLFSGEFFLSLQHFVWWSGRFSNKCHQHWIGGLQEQSLQENQDDIPNHSHQHCGFQHVSTFNPQVSISLPSFIHFLRFSSPAKLDIGDSGCMVYPQMFHHVPQMLHQLIGLRKQITGTSHRNHGRIWLVSYRFSLSQPYFMGESMVSG